MGVGGRLNSQAQRPPPHVITNIATSLWRSITKLHLELMKLRTEFGLTAHSRSLGLSLGQICLVLKSRI